MNTRDTLLKLVTRRVVTYPYFVIMNKALFRKLISSFKRKKSEKTQLTRTDSQLKGTKV